MSKGVETRQAIIDEALKQASLVGLEALSIGELASSLALSKSGLFAHFGSKEKLQVAVIETAVRRFIEVVVVPALRTPRGEPRLLALIENWMTWDTASAELPGGCVFIAAAAVVDDQPGAVREALVQSQRDWLDTIAHAAGLAVREKHFRADLDCQQFAFDLYALLIGCHHYHRLLRDPRSIERTRAAVELLLSNARRP